MSILNILFIRDRLLEAVEKLHEVGIIHGDLLNPDPEHMNGQDEEDRLMFTDHVGIDQAQGDTVRITGFIQSTRHDGPCPRTCHGSTGDTTGLNHQDELVCPELDAVESYIGRRLKKLHRH